MTQKTKHIQTDGNLENKVQLFCQRFKERRQILFIKPVLKFSAAFQLRTFFFFFPRAIQVSVCHTVACWHDAALLKAKG